MTAIAWIAVDWGTSNLRAWAMAADNQVVAERQSDQGMAVLDSAQFEITLIALVDDWLGGEKTPIVACGMVGARQGWVEAPYASVPSSAVMSAQPVTTQDCRVEVYVLGGLRQDQPADVMRGEETQIAGFLVQQPTFTGAMCLPGTHTKWVQINNGIISQFQTIMTGELFHLLAYQSILRFNLGGWDETIFLQGIDRAISADTGMIDQLFSIRARSLLHGDNDGLAMLSGLLIGAELKATRAYWQQQELVIIGDQPLAQRYQSALTSLGIAPQMSNAATMTINGLSQVYREYCL